MIFIKKILIMIFISLSTFFLVSAFITKANNKEPITFNYVLNRLKDANINFSIQQDIKDVRENMVALDNNVDKSGDGWTQTFTYLRNILNNTYYGIRFAFTLIVHVLSATIDVITIVIDCLGF